MSDPVNRQQDQDIGALRAEVEALRREVTALQQEIEAGAGKPRGLYAAVCGDYKMLAVAIIFGGGFSLLAVGSILAVVGIISLADLREFMGIAKGSIPVLPTGAE